MWSRVVRATSALAVAVVAVAASPIAVGAATAPSAPTQASVDKVLVNATGGIMMWGKLDCGKAVADHYGGSVPADVSVSAHIDWTARQPVGRTTMLVATYSQQGFEWSCFNNNADGSHGPVCGEGTGQGACPWLTSRDASNKAGWWVYAPNGKLTRGPIHVELDVAGFSGNGSAVVGGVAQPVTVGVTIAPLAFELKARRP